MLAQSAFDASVKEHESGCRSHLQGCDDVVGMDGLDVLPNTIEDLCDSLAQRQQTRPMALRII